MDDETIFLPFSGLNNIELNSVLNSDSIVGCFGSIEYLDKLTYSPIVPQNNTHNNDLDVDNFLINTRHLSIPESNYLFLNDTQDDMTEIVNSFTVLSLNIRSIPKNLQLFIDLYLSDSKRPIDIMGFQETRLDNNISSLYNLPGYKSYNQCRNRDGGGVSLYVSDVYSSSLILDLCCTDQSLECVAVEISYPNGNYFCASIYRPPKGNIPNFIEKLNNMLCFISQKSYKNIYIFGDWNIDLLKHKTNSINNEFVTLMYSNYCFPLITKPTRVCETGATLIDNIWSTDVDSNFKNIILYSDTSDHFPVLSYFSRTQGNTELAKNNIIKTRIYSKTATDKFVQDVSNLSWNNVYDLNCVNEAFDMFSDPFTTSFMNNFPLKNQTRSNKNLLSPHITPAFKKSISEKKRLERLAAKWPLSFREKYKTYRNQLTKLLKIAKNKYYKDDLKENQGNGRATWRTINHILGKPKHTSRNETIILNNESTNAAETFNQYFLKIGSHNINDEEYPYNAHLNYLKDPPNFSFYLSPVTENEIKSLLNSFKPTSPGYDDIPPKLLRLTSEFIAAPLCYTINLSFKTGIFPSKLKIAKVTPIYKTGDVKETNNYRPISILLAFSKIFEKCIASRLTNYLESNNLLTDSQHGFRQNRSTETALLQFTSNIYKSLNDKNLVAGIFLDLSKAFDSLNHTILIDKLRNIGIRGLPLQLFSNYLTDRKQTVYCNNEYSSFGTICHGVPQGSVLGPILFLVYINDIIYASQRGKYVIFADDTNVLYSARNSNNLHALVTEECKSILKWIKVNKLKLNINKSKLIIFQNRSVVTNFHPVIFGDQPMERVAYTNFLGVIVDEYLNWKMHIQSVCLKLSKICGIIYRIRHQLTKEAMVCIYYSLCYPHITYCLSVWGCTWPSYLVNVSIAQKRILRTIYFKGKYETTEPIYAELNLLNFYSIHKYFLLLTIFKSINVQINNSPIFCRTAHGLNTRGQSVNLVCPPARVTLFQNSILYNGPKTWNSLSGQLKSINNLDAFKRNIKKYIYESQQNNIQQ